MQPRHRTKGRQAVEWNSVQTKATQNSECGRGAARGSVVAKRTETNPQAMYASTCPHIDLTNRSADTSSLGSLYDPLIASSCRDVSSVAPE